MRRLRGKRKLGLAKPGSSMADRFVVYVQEAREGEASVCGSRWDSKGEAGVSVPGLWSFGVV